jgi:hypothetical protein
MDDIVVHHHPSPRREGGRRRRLLLRNAIWGAWLRRPAPSALRLTLGLVRLRRRDPALVPALAAALRGAPWVLRRRRVVPAEVEQRLRAIEAHRR